MNKEKEYYTAREAAKYLGIPMHRLARLRRQGRLKSITPDSEARYVVYHIDELRTVDLSDLRTGPRKKRPGEPSEDVQPPLAVAV